LLLLADQRPLTLTTTPDNQRRLAAREDPEVFSASRASGRFAWVEINLAKVDPELVELVTEGWRLSAPKRLAAALAPVSSATVFAICRGLH
jgi:hypothetical protein